MKELVCFFCVLIFFSSCSEPDINFDKVITLNNEKINEGAKVKLVENSERDSIYKNIAINIANQLNNQGVVKFFKSEAGKRFDKETNFLIISSKEKLIEGVNKKFASLFIPDQFSKKMEADFPLTHIYLNSGSEMEFEKININDRNIKVGYVSSNITLDYIPAFDINGNLVKLSKTIQPKHPTIIITENERTIVIEKNSNYNILKKLYTSPKFDIVLKSDFYDFENIEILSKLSKNKKKGLRVYGISSCSRDNNPTFKDRFNEFKFNNSSSYDGAKDGWFDGTLEITSDIIFAGPTPWSLKKIWPIWEGHLKDLNWRTLFDTEILTWNKSLYGDAYKIEWLEDDGGGTETRTSSFSTTVNGVTSNVNLQYVIPKKHYLLGSSLVQYCDDISNGGMIYSTGRISFKIHKPF